MTARKNEKKSRSDEKSTASVGRPDSGQPGGGQGRVDVTGIVPEGVHPDPDITEGHPGYQESGGSEIIPNKRLSEGQGGK